MLLGSLTSSVTSSIAAHGLVAVFLLMLLDALLPAASELVMVYAGAAGTGAFAGSSLGLFGHSFSAGFPGFTAAAVAGTIGYTVGALGGWLIGQKAGRPFLERRGRFVHLTPERLARADDWFARRGDMTVLIGRVTPVVRSFISIPAGIARMPLGRYLAFTLVGSAVWAFAFAAVGWGIGAGYRRVHSAFDVVTAACVVVALLLVATAIIRTRRRRRLNAA